MDWNFRTTPYSHQLEALERSWERDEYALLMEMGTGKSKVAIDTMAASWRAGRIRGAVVLAPKGAYMNWVEHELPTHMPDDVPVQVEAWRGMGSVSRRAAMGALLGDCGGRVPILVMNTEALSGGDSAWDMCRSFLMARPSIMVVDESTRIKNPRAERTKSIVRLGQLAAMRRIMTGMPVTRSPLDLYSQFDFLRTGILGHRSFFAFRNMYAIRERKFFGSRSVDVVVGYQNLDELHRRIQPHSYRVLKQDCLDLPPKVYQLRPVELSTEQVRAYGDMLKNATTQLSGGEHVTATEAITILMRLHQISCGHVRDELGGVHELHEHRTAALVEVAEECSGPLVVWSAYRADIPRIVAALSRMGNVVEYHGGISQADRQLAMLRFHSGDARYFVGTQQTGGMGNTMVEADTMVYYSNSYDLEHRVQSEDRIHRIGQTRACTYIDLVAEGTVDEKVIHALRAKIDISAVVTGDNIREWLV